MGLYGPEDAYLNDNWNCMDAFVALVPAKSRLHAQLTRILFHL